jgi:sarcosine oxidase delta subunit
MDEVECPYCGEDFEINHDDGQHYEDGKSASDYCPNCDKQVMISTSVSYYHEIEKADCLNEISDHDWSSWYFLWFNDDFTKKIERRYCNVCDEEERETHDLEDSDEGRLKMYKEAREKYRR